MTIPTHAHSPLVIERFCALCDRAHECWLNHLELFDGNSRNTEFLESVIKDEWMRLFAISQEYSLLQIVKLHDPAVMNNNITLGIEYVFTYGNWSASVRDRLTTQKKKLDVLANKLRGVRNKILSHNDFATILDEATLGAFDEGTDTQYFAALQEFVNIVHDQVIGGEYPFCSLVKSDAAFFLRSINPISLKEN